MKERLIGGFHSLAMSADPPAKCIVHFEDEGNHVGYGATVQLQSGLVGISTPKHVLGESTMIVGSRGKMAVSNFRVVFDGGDLDLCVLIPKNESIEKQWRSALGVKPRKMKPVTQVGTGGYRIFSQNETGSWFCQPAQIKGLSDDRVCLRVEYNSEAGFSGLPIFDNKSCIVALHQGAHPNARENVAVFLPDLPGFSSPNLTGYMESVYEDTAILKGVYDEDTDSLHIKARVYGKSITVPISYKYQKKVFINTDWNDLPDDDEDFYATDASEWLKKFKGERENAKTKKAPECQVPKCRGKCPDSTSPHLTTEEFWKRIHFLEQVVDEQRNSIDNLLSQYGYIHERMVRMDQFLNSHKTLESGSLNGAPRSSAGLTKDGEVKKTTPAPTAAKAAGSTNGASANTKDTATKSGPTGVAGAKKTSPTSSDKKPRPALTSEQKKARNLRQRLKRKEKRAARRAEQEKATPPPKPQFPFGIDLKSVEKAVIDALKDHALKRPRLSKRKSRTSTTSKRSQGTKPVETHQKASDGQGGAKPFTTPPATSNSSQNGEKKDYNFRPGWQKQPKASDNPGRAPKPSSSA